MAVATGEEGENGGISWRRSAWPVVTDVQPGARRGEVQAELHGKLAEILNATTRPELTGRVVITSLDAGARLDRGYSKLTALI